MNKLTIAVLIAILLGVFGYLAYDAGRDDAYAEAHNCTWSYDKAGFRELCIPKD